MWDKRLIQWTSGHLTKQMYVRFQNGFHLNNLGHNDLIFKILKIVE